MIEALFFVLLAWGIFLLGYLVLRDFTTTVFGSLLFMAVGSYGLVFGLIGLSNPINTSFSLVHLGLGLYWIVKSSIKLSNDPVAKIFDLRTSITKLLSRRNKNGISKKTITQGRARTGRARRT